jgi:hypothetical protein
LVELITIPLGILRSLRSLSVTKNIIVLNKVKNHYIDYLISALSNEGRLLVTSTGSGSENFVLLGIPQSLASLALSE